MIEDKEKYLQNILKEIEEAKVKNKHTIYRINSKISNSLADYVKKYFQGNPAYTVNTKKCITCKGTWDIIINF